MPLPLLVIGGVAAANLAVTGASMVRTRIDKKRYQEAETDTQAAINQANQAVHNFNTATEALAQAKLDSAATLRQAAEYLEKAKVKHRDFTIANPEFTARMETIKLQSQVLNDLMGTITGSAAAAFGYGATAVPQAIYAFVGMFGTASTGAAISGLSGAAQHSATMAAIGRAIPFAAGNMAGGASALGTIGSVMSSLNIVMMPVGIAAAAWSVKKAKDNHRQIGEAIEKMAAAQVKAIQQESVLKAGISRSNEIKSIIQREHRNLREQLAISDQHTQEEMHIVFRLADLLGKTIDTPILTPAQQQTLGINNPAPTA